MEVIVVLVFVSLMLVIGALVLLGRSIRAGDFEHGERLSLLPLEADDQANGERNAAPSGEESHGR